MIIKGYETGKEILNECKLIFDRPLYLYKDLHNIKYMKCRYGVKTFLYFTECPYIFNIKFNLYINFFPLFVFYLSPHSTYYSDFFVWCLSKFEGHKPRV